MATAIVASVMPRDGAELRELGARARPHASLIEVRADRWSGSGSALAAALEALGRATIVTARPRSEGGAFPGSEEERGALLRAAARAAGHVDVEERSPFARESFAPARKIVSVHDPAATPPDLEALAARLRGAHPDAAFVKLAATPRSLADVGRLARLQRTQSGAAPLLVAMGMGELGLPTRLLAGRNGAPLVYGRVEGGEPTAPGQPGVRELAELYRVGAQSAATAVRAIAGRPLAHSWSPALHNALYARHRLDFVFVPLPAAALEEALAAADALGIDGLSVTLPFKEEAAAAARGAVPGFPFPPPEGAANTLVRGASGWLAANTDRAGLTAALAQVAPGLLERGRSALVLGAGGAARTAVALLAGRGISVAVAGRTTGRAEELARALGARAVDFAACDASRFDLVINATPVGMHPHADASPLPDGALRAGQVVLDLVYRPRVTRLLRQAQAAGAHAIDGLGMFVAQALAQFELFTGVAGDAAAARATVERLASAPPPEGA